MRVTYILEPEMIMSAIIALLFWGYNGLSFFLRKISKMLRNRKNN